jgi:stage II sporulation protein D
LNWIPKASGRGLWAKLVVSLSPEEKSACIWIGTDISSPSFRIRAKDDNLLFNGVPRRGTIVLTMNSKGIAVINNLPLEQYLVGLVNGEISSKWPPEAVKSQVVAARTFALYRMQENQALYDVRDDIGDQVYPGAVNEDRKAKKAVKATRGQALYYDNELLPAFYHSACGGRTADAAEVWGTAHQALISVVCGDCDDARRSRWQAVMDQRQLQSILDDLYPGMGPVRSVGVHRRSIDGRAAVMALNTADSRVLVSTGDFRREAGYMTLLSTMFTIRGEGGKVIFDGRGFGHGVGLCQWGARGASERGWNYRQILGKYYPGSEIRKIY